MIELLFFNFDNRIICKSIVNFVNILFTMNLQFIIIIEVLQNGLMDQRKLGVGNFGDKCSTIAF